MSSDVSNVLILRALGLGDFLTAQAAYRGLRQAFPDAVITLAAPQPLEPLARLGTRWTPCSDHRIRRLAVARYAGLGDDCVLAGKLISLDLLPWWRQPSW